MQKSRATDLCWSEFRASRPGTPSDYRLLWFGGDDKALATKLGNLVLHGTKRATTTLKRDFDTGKEPVFPSSGDLWLLVDGNGSPLGVIETMRVDVRRYGDVDAQFAWDEGEGDRTLAYWRTAHDSYFGRQAAQEGFVFSNDNLVVLEWLRLIWPIAEATANSG